jgi:hypothetical protein
MEYSRRLSKCARCKFNKVSDCLIKTCKDYSAFEPQDIVKICEDTDKILWVGKTEIADAWYATIIVFKTVRAFPGWVTEYHTFPITESDLKESCWPDGELIDFLLERSNKKNESGKMFEVDSIVINDKEIYVNIALKSFDRNFLSILLDIPNFKTMSRHRVYFKRNINK